MIKVYAAGGTRSRRVLWALEEVGVPYEVATVKFPPRLLEPEYLVINPTGVLPAITDGDVVLIESLAICDYISRKHGGSLTLAADETGYDDYQQLVFYGEATLAPPLGWARRFGKYPDALSDARETFSQRLTYLQHKLADGRAYLAAERLTLADISVGYALGLASLVGVSDLIPPDVAAYEARLKARPAYQRAYQHA